MEMRKYRDKGKGIGDQGGLLGAWLLSAWLLVGIVLPLGAQQKVEPQPEARDCAC